MQLGVDFREGGKAENPEKNPRSTGEITYDNSIHMNPNFEIQHRWSPIQLLTPSLTWSLMVKPLQKFHMNMFQNHM